MADDFPVKLALVLKALAISRGRLAADLGVDKSVVSRWMSGVYSPSGENLSQLTRLIAARRPGFTGLDWDRDLAGLTALFGAELQGSPAGADLPQLPGLEGARTATARIGEAFEGLWHGWRAAFQRRGVFARDTFWIRRRGDFLAVTMNNERVRAEGWLLPGDGRSFMMVSHRYSDVPSTLSLYSTEGARLQVMDGLLTTVTATVSRSFLSAPYVMVRHADLTGDPAADQALFEQRAALETAFDTQAVAPDIVARLGGGQDSAPQIQMSGDGSLARSATRGEAEAAAAAAFLRDRT